MFLSNVGTLWKRSKLTLKLCIHLRCEKSVKIAALRNAFDSWRLNKESIQKTEYAQHNSKIKTGDITKEAKIRDDFNSLLKHVTPSFRDFVSPNDFARIAKSTKHKNDFPRVCTKMFREQAEKKRMFQSKA